MAYPTGNVKELLLADVTHLVVHCSATSPSIDIGAKEIDRWHRDRGFFCIGYHFVIRRNGAIEEGRPVDRVGAHVEGWNSRSLGICMVGGLDEDGKAKNNFTPKQFASLADLLSTLLKLLPDTQVVGHRDIPGVKKACPSFDVKRWLTPGIAG